MNDKKEWLDTLKVGDEVLVTSRYSIEIKKIDKITPTNQIKIGSMTFKNGRNKGTDVYHWGYEISPVTQKVRDHIRKLELAKKIGMVVFSELSLGKLESILEIIDSTEPPSETEAE